MPASVPPGRWSIAADAHRLANAAARAIGPAIGLAFLSAGTLLVFGSSGALLPGEISAWIVVAAFLWFHGIFIAALTWHRIKSAGPLLKHLVHPGFAAGAILALPLAAFAVIDETGASYSCADGSLSRDSSIPDLPWLWIGWAALAVSAAPARAVGLVIGQQPRLIPLTHRIGLTAAVSPPILVTGLLFQWRNPDCALPREGFGLFEGGLFLLPLFGLFLFLMSFTLAVLAATFVAPDVVTVRKNGDPQP